jgi:hypothetical protein
MIGFTIITLIHHTGDVVRAAAPTIQLRAERFDWHHFYDVHKSGTLLVADEGVTWIRGDHPEDSSEVESLKAANMLARGDEAPRTEPKISYHDMAMAQLPRPRQLPSAPPRFRPVPARNVSSFRRR